MSVSDCLLNEVNCEQAMENYCGSYSTTLDWEITGVFQKNNWYLFLVLLSGLGYSLLALAIYFNPALQVHPMKLHMMISFVGASIFFNYYFANQLCSFQLYKLLAATIYF